MARHHFCKNHEFSNCPYYINYQKINNTVIWRIIISVVALLITGKITIGKTGDGSVADVGWFVSMLMFVLSYLPDALVEEDHPAIKAVRLIQLLVAGFLGIVSILGVFGVLRLMSVNNKMIMQTAEEYIFGGLNLGRLLYWWLPSLAFEATIIIRNIAAPAIIRKATMTDRK